ncbi:MAG: hypothetical protein H6869_08585 [Rhodospirillales bacterium]|nr:hypothetical protein [Rhodospirillales bacterium]
MNAALTVHFAPLLPDALLYGIGIAALALFLFSALFYRRGLFWRSICAAAFVLILLNPSLVEEERKAASDVVAVVIDRSPSQQNGQRTARTDAAQTDLEQKLKLFAGLDVRVIEAPAAADILTNETRLFDALDRVIGDVPLERRAGAIFVTDGQIHDIPVNEDHYNDYGPVQVLLSGDKDERDRQIVVKEAPAYGIVGETVTVRYKIEDVGQSGESYATVITRINDETPKIDLVPVGVEQRVEVTIKHAGQNIVDIQASPLDDEITLANNRLPLIINGVRDRLRVLLVSGQPHAGGRTWRNILTADPGVDLVHFTILREPNKLDATPQNELSLIAFPFRELFEVKLYDFDLIIFDRYRLNRILPNYYFANIANYVKKGGALLEASGPAFATDDSVYSTALKDVLPAYPTGQVYQESYTPAVTDTGHRHPVTQDLQWRSDIDQSEGWGPWLRQVAVQPMSGNILMTGAKNQPLLILDRVGEGRIAQMASDQIWLWANGYKGGGPQAELLRRLAHWLMKEPELEENALDVRTNGMNIIMTRRSLTNTPIKVNVTAPDGTEQNITLEEGPQGALEGRLKAEQLGIYTVDDGNQKRFAIIGELNPPELRSVQTTGEKLAPISSASGGGIHWLADDGTPHIKLLPPGRSYNGSGWLGLRQNRSYTVTGVKETPFLPSWFYALSLFSLLIAAWWFEGRSRKKSN